LRSTTQTAGTEDQYVHFVEKAVGASTDVEWALRFYNQTNPARRSRLPFYTFNLGSPAGKGNGSYMQYGHSNNADRTRQMDFRRGAGGALLSTGCILWKQAVEAKRQLADSGDFKVHPQQGSGLIRVGGTQETGFKGAIAHLPIWNRLLSTTEITSIWTAGATDLRNSAMYHSYA